MRKVAGAMVFIAAAAIAVFALLPFVSNTPTGDARAGPAIVLDLGQSHNAVIGTAAVPLANPWAFITHQATDFNLNNTNNNADTANSATRASPYSADRQRAGFLGTNASTTTADLASASTVDNSATNDVQGLLADVTTGLAGNPMIVLLLVAISALSVALLSGGAGDKRVRFGGAVST